MKRIDQDIKDNQFNKVYLLFGEESYLRIRYKDKLIKALTNDGDTLNFSTYSGKDIPAGEIIDLAETMPFLSDRRVILIENSEAFNSGGDLAEILSTYIKTLPESTCIIFNEDNVDKRSKMFKAVKAAGYCASFERLSPEDIKKWLLVMIKKEGKQITGPAYESFIATTGNDMMLIQAEFEKIIAYTYGKSSIDLKDVQAICTPHIEDKIFAMLDNMMNGKTGLALSQYGDLLALREPPAKILFMITRQVKMLLHTKVMLGEGKSEAQIASILGVNPYAIKMIAPSAKKISKKRLSDILNLCADTDTQSKSGIIDAQIGVELIIVSVGNGDI